MLPRHGLPWAILTAAAIAQFPQAPTDITTIYSEREEGVYVSYKPASLCETNPGVRSFSGYVHLPPQNLDDLDVNQTYPINAHFWFVESRNDPVNSPLSIWMNGGPGSSSMLGALRELGPCNINADSNSTRNNPWAWNNRVNMLFLDQPVQVGMSYDVLTNVTVNLATGDTEVADFSQGVPEQNNTFYVGTFGSQNPNQTTRGTANSARAMWHFAQTWFQDFPEHRPNDSRISIATESYGGRYGPAYAEFFEEQNQKILNGTWNETGLTEVLDLDTLLIINGCIDRLVQFPFYPQMAYNNTYGIEGINQTRFEESLDAFNREGGCRDQIEACRALASEFDPTNQGFNASVNRACQQAETFCVENLRDPYLDDSGRNYYDIGAINPAAFPEPFYAGWLNQPQVQADFGVPLNWTQSNGAVSSAFRGIGDYPRPGHLEALADLLSYGVKVTLMYGDRDYACNWLGGEAVSTAIPWAQQEAFASAGYSAINVNSTFVGGQVRQYGNLSFARVYQAGHEVPAYQPETALAIFERALFNRDISTGEVDTLATSDYATEGPTSVFDIKNDPPAMPSPTCYVLDRDQCTPDQWDTVVDGSALVRNWIVVDNNTRQLFPELGNVILPGEDSTSAPAPTPSANAASSMFGGMTVFNVEVNSVGNALLAASGAITLLLL